MNRLVYIAPKEIPPVIDDGFLTWLLTGLTTFSVLLFGVNKKDAKDLRAADKEIWTELGKLAEKHNNMATQIATRADVAAAVADVKDSVRRLDAKLDVVMGGGRYHSD